MIRVTTAGILQQMRGRYSGRTIDELREVAIASNNDPEVFGELEEEMKVRIKRRIDKGQKPKKEQVEFLKELESRSAKPPAGGKVAPAKREEAPDELSRLRAEIELWRSLYSAASERLARWGITETMPERVLVAAVAAWREHLACGGGDLVRTQDQLNRDFPATNVPAGARKKC